MHLSSAGISGSRKGEYRQYSLHKHRYTRRPFPRLQVGLQAVQEVFPVPARLFIGRINLSEPIMCEDQCCPVLDRRELPGDAGCRPMRRTLPENLTHVLSGVQFGNLKFEDTSRWSKAKFSKRAHLWPDRGFVSPPAHYLLLLRQGSEDSFRRGCNGEFFENGWHHRSFLLNVARRQYLTNKLSIDEKGNSVKGFVLKNPFYIAWNKKGRMKQAIQSEVEMRSGENPGQRIKQGRPARSKERT